MNKQDLNAQIFQLDEIPAEIPPFAEGIRRAPKRESHLTQSDKETAIMNALRYIPK